MAGPIRRPVSSGIPEGTPPGAKKPAAAKPVTADTFSGVTPVKKNDKQETRTVVTKNTMAIQTTTKKPGGSQEVHTEVHHVKIPSPQDKGQRTREAVQTTGKKWQRAEGGQSAKGPTPPPLPKAIPLSAKTAPSSPQGKTSQTAQIVAAKRLPPLPPLPQKASKQEPAQPMKKLNLTVQVPGTVQASKINTPTPEKTPKTADRRKQAIEQIKGQRTPPSPKEGSESPSSAKPARPASPMERMAARRAIEAENDEDVTTEFRHDTSLIQEHIKRVDDAEANRVPDLVGDAGDKTSTGAHDFFSEFGDLGMGLYKTSSPKAPTAPAAPAEQLQKPTAGELTAGASRLKKPAAPLSKPDTASQSPSIEKQLKAELEARRAAMEEDEDEGLSPSKSAAQEPTTPPPSPATPPPLPGKKFKLPQRPGTPPPSQEKRTK